MKRYLSRPRRLLAALGALALLLMLSAAGFPAAPAPANMAFVRLVHASPDVGIVAVFVDGNRLLSSFQFATVTQYAPLAAGSHTIQIASLGTGTNAATMTQTVMVQPNTAYTIAVIGTKQAGTSFAIFTDNDAVAGTQTKLRVYHLSPGTASVSVDMGAHNIIQGLAYPQVSDYISLPAGQHTFGLNDAAQNVSATFSVMLKPWTVTSVFAIGQISGSQKLQFVTAQVQGIPSMPNTGSDPTPVVQAQTGSMPPMLWPIGLLLALLVGGGAGWFSLASRRRSGGEG